MADADPRFAATRRLLSGTAALVELPLLQRRLDRAAGLNTGGYISGYRGSPLGGYDQELTLAKARLEAENIRFQPGLNEDLAATAIWGTQQLGLFPGATVDGVFGIWYGKGPGVDRSLDALKHGNAAGSAAKGGVLLVAGDDHGCVSSTLPHQSEQVFAAAMIPVLNPSSVAEIIEYGLLGIALSRFSGCWVAMTGASEVIETSAMVDLAAPPDIVLPSPPENLHLRWPDPPLDQERRLHVPKMAAVRAFTVANRIDRVMVDCAEPKLVIVTTGKAYGDVREALAMLGDVPVRVFKVGMSWPLGGAAIDAVAGAEEVLVVEEKRGFVEEQLVGLLCNRSERPRVVGKAEGVLPTNGELGPVMVARAIADRLQAITGKRPPGAPPPPVPATAADSAVPQRAPFFCAGCPHNGSTLVPEGSRAMGGIGCHGMATWMPDRSTAFLTHMGAEGATWLGQAPFTTEPHIFQNMGDGTYNHSGLLAIRAAIAAGVSITYKILYNDAVAMTGGQPHDGAVTVEGIAAQMLAEGAREVVVVSEAPERFAAGAIPVGVPVHKRAELDAVQRRLREIAGVTIIVYDQTCAAELRRRRKSDATLRRTRHIMINPEVCEGCGDCSIVSNCIAIQPLETPLGRKRRIDPASCNQDYSCVEGHCPSFVSVETSRVDEARADAGGREAPDDLASPTLPNRADIVIAGIGGTGVVTIGAILGAAAESQGLECTLLDITGLSQKNGAVMSQVRLRPAGDPIHAARVPEGAASLLLACDLVAAAAPAALSRCGVATQAIGNGDMAPTAAFIRDGGADFGRFAAARRIGSVCAGAPELVDAAAQSERLAGSAAAANILLLGYAWQRGLIPLGLDAIETAIGKVVRGSANLNAFRWGRALADDPELARKTAAAPEVLTLAALIEDRARRLTAYQNAAFADLYRARIERVAAAERERVGGTDALARAAADALYRLMAVKDEYEVARLHLSDDFARELRARFGPDAKLSYHLAAPILGARKRRFGAWMRPVFRLLAGMRKLRGGPFDLFGRTAERRAERALELQFVAELETFSKALDRATHAKAIAFIEATQLVRGFGHVKLKNIERYQARIAALRNMGDATEAATPAVAASLDKKDLTATVR